VSAEKRYHHGSLRAALLEAALDEIAVVGTSRLSLREVARRAGVSHAAPRHHFSDKGGLLTAIAAEGYRVLAEVTERAAATGRGLVDVGLAYVRFALDHPAFFAVMFRPDVYNPSDGVLAEARDDAAGVLLNAVAREFGVDASDDVVRDGAIAAWAMTHGFATLWLNGNLDFAGEPDALRLAARAFAVVPSLRD
jgi:AcrR family transcriptional regulator